MSNSKTPYEIRLEVLQMAKEMMDKEYESAVSKYWDMVDQATKTNQKLLASMPDMYRPDQVMKKALELYGFVNNKV